MLPSQKPRLFIAPDPGDDYLGGDGAAAAPVPIQAFLHMIGIGEDPASDAAKAKAAKGLALSPKKYDRERKSLDKRSQQPVPVGTLVFNGAAVISGRPYRLVAVLASRGVLEAQNDNAARLDCGASLSTGGSGGAGGERLSATSVGTAVSMGSRTGVLGHHDDHKVLISAVSRKYYEKTDDRKKSRRAGIPVFVHVWPLASEASAAASPTPMFDGDCLPEGDPLMSVAAALNPCSSIPSNPPTLADIRSSFLFTVLPLLAVVNRDSAVHRPPFERPRRSLMLTPTLPPVARVSSLTASVAADDGAVADSAAASPQVAALSATHLAQTPASWNASPSTTPAPVLSPLLQRRVDVLNAAAQRAAAALTGAEKQLVVVTDAYIERYREMDWLRQEAEAAKRREEEAVRERLAFDAAPHWQEVAGLVSLANRDSGSWSPDPTVAASSVAMAASVYDSSLLDNDGSVGYDSEGSFSYTDGSSYSYSASSSDSDRGGDNDAAGVYTARFGTSMGAASGQPRLTARSSLRQQPSESRAQVAARTSYASSAPGCNSRRSSRRSSGSTGRLRKLRRSAASGQLSPSPGAAGEADTSLPIRRASRSLRNADADRCQRMRAPSSLDTVSEIAEQHGFDVEDVEQAPVPLDQQPVDDPAAIALRLWAGGDDAALQAALAEQEAALAQRKSGTSARADGADDADAAMLPLRRESVAPPPASTELGLWLNDHKLGRHELRMFQLGIRAMSDLDHVTEADLDLLGFNYVERHRLWRELSAMKQARGQREAQANALVSPGGVIGVAGGSDGISSGAAAGQQTPGDEAQTQTPRKSAAGAGAVVTRPLSRSLNEALEATSLQHRRELMERADIVMWHDLESAARNTNDWLRRTLGLTAFECRKLRTVLQVTTAAPTLAVMSPSDIDLPGFHVKGGYAALSAAKPRKKAVVFSDGNSVHTYNDEAQLLDSGSDGDEWEERKRERGTGDMTDVLTAVLSTLGVGASESRFRELGVAKPGDLYRLTDADLDMIGMGLREKLEFRAALKTLKAGYIKRQKVAHGGWTSEDDAAARAARSRRERLEDAAEEAELRLVRARVWVVRSCWPRFLTWVEPLLIRLRLCPCAQPPSVTPLVRRQDRCQQLRMFIQLTTPGLKPWFGRRVFWSRVCACVFAFLSFIIMSSAKGKMAVEQQTPAVATYHDEPDLQFVVATGIFIWFWVPAVYTYYILVTKGKIRAFNYGHLAEVITETVLWFFAVLASALGFKRAPGYELFPTFKRAILGSCAMLFLAWLCLCVSVTLLWFSGRLTMKGPSIAAYNIEEPEPEKPRIVIHTGGDADVHDAERGEDPDFLPT